MTWYAAHAANPERCPQPTRRQIRAAARLLTVQSARGNRDADTIAAELHRAGWDLRDVSRLSAWFDRRWIPILLGATVVVLALVCIVAVLASGGAAR